MKLSFKAVDITNRRKFNRVMKVFTGEFAFDYDSENGFWQITSDYGLYVIQMTTSPFEFIISSLEEDALGILGTQLLNEAINLNDKINNTKDEAEFDAALKELKFLLERVDDAFQSEGRSNG